LIPVRRNGRDIRVPAVSELLADLKWEQGWLCGWRDVCRATGERTAIPAFLPRVAVGNKFHLMFPSTSPLLSAALIAAQSSLVFDFISRQKIGNIAMGLFIWEQLPVPTPAMLEPHTAFLTPRVLELVYTAYDMAPLAPDLGDSGAPFTWDEERRAQIRAELDAFFFRLYRIERDDVDYIMETFQTESGGLKNNDIAKYGTYRTKDLILDAYDRMANSDAAGVPMRRRSRRLPAMDLGTLPARASRPSDDLFTQRAWREFMFEAGLATDAARAKVWVRQVG